MSQESVAVVSAWLAAWNRTDSYAMDQCFTSDCEVYAPEGWLESGPCKDWSPSVARWRTSRDSWESERVEADELRDLGERVLARWRWVTVGKRSGIASETEVTAVSTVRERKIIRVDYFLDHTQALKAAGLEE